MCNKTQAICDLILENDVDVLCITETWLKGNITDSGIISELTPDGFITESVPRATRGGGVAVVARKHLSLKTLTACDYTTFECIDCQLETQPRMRILLVYRAPCASISVFIQELEELLEKLTCVGGELLILGDFNVHFEDSNCNQSGQLKDLCNSFGLVQHVHGPTHRHGHTLDLLFTKSECSLSLDLDVQDLCISDHSAVFCNLVCTVPNAEIQCVEYRNLKKIKPAAMSADIAGSTLMNPLLQESDLNMQVDSYSSVLAELLQKHAPLKRRIFPQRVSSPWYSDELRRSKQLRRKSERKWRKTGLQVHREDFERRKKETEALVIRAKANYFHGLITEHEGNPRKLFQVVSKLLGSEKNNPLLQHHDLETLVKSFSDFFEEKVDGIRAGIGGSAASDAPPPAPLEPSLSALRPASEAEVRRIIFSSPTKHSSLDPIPTWLLKQCIDVLLPLITAIINQSLTTGEVPKAFKTALISPLLKKPTLDSSVLSNFRPVSNLSFLSKVLEKVVSGRLSDYLTEHGFQEVYQSAYRKHHSTETALIRVHNDILLALSEKKACLMLLLDLSAAFDTVDHAALIDVLAALGVKDRALDWFRSYLSERFQCVQIGSHCSTPKALKWGVPQGSVLGPVLF